MKIAFIDAKCPAPYDSEILRNRGLGGTEATVIRIAQALSQWHDVRVVQHNRAHACMESSSLQFLPIDALDGAVKDSQHVVFVQKAQYIRQVARLTPGRLWLWLHNYVKDEVPFFWRDHLAHRLGIICVSKTHATHTLKYLRSLAPYWASLGLLNRGGLLYLYNPIDATHGAVAGIEKDLHKLVFFSSPHKGIEQVIDAFRSIHAVDGRFKLYVADPGYIKTFDAGLLDAPGIVRLGSLPQRAILEHVQQALCVFYPQRKRPETFGLVYAEANAVGTPVLAHDFGSAREILAGTNPPIDASDRAQVSETLMTWVAEGAPVVGAKPEFLVQNVAKQWDSFFHKPDAFIDAQAKVIQRHATEEEFSPVPSLDAFGVQAQVLSHAQCEAQRSPVPWTEAR